MRTLFVLLCAYLAIALAGCAGSVPPSQLEPPAKVLMQDPEPLPKVKAGDDLVKEDIKVRRMYVALAGKTRRLQRYVRTVRGE